MVVATALCVGLAYSEKTWMVWRWSSNSSDFWPGIQKDTTARSATTKLPSTKPWTCLSARVHRREHFLVVLDLSA